MTMDRSQVEAMVREVVTRIIGSATVTTTTFSTSHTQPAGERRSPRPVIDEEVVRALPPGSVFPLPPQALVTPLARQVALERRIAFEPQGDGVSTPVVSPSIQSSGSGARVVAIGADHGGFELKQKLKELLLAEGSYAVVDCGTHSTDSVDYPDFAYAVARMVGTGKAWRGIIIDGAGIGSCMVANKVPGVRAAMCYDQATAVNSREHNNANVLTLGAGLIGSNLARQIVQVWLDTEFGGGRHARRVDKIERIERRFTR